MLELMRTYRVTRLKTADVELEMAQPGPEQAPAPVGGPSFRDMTGIDPESDPKLAELVQRFASQVVESASDEDRYAD